MKIAYVVTRTDAVGGASIHVRDLARAMLDRGHEVVALAGGSGPVRDLIEREAVPFRSLKHLHRGVNPVADFRATRELAAVLRDLQPDLVSAHTAKAGWIGRAAGRRTGRPVIYTPHGWTIGDRISPKQGVFFRLAERAASRWGPAIVCVCEQERLLALEHGIAPAEKLYVVHNGVRDVPPDMRADPELQPARIISVARLEPPKDQITLVHALAALSSLEWQLDLVGDGPRETKIRHLVRELGIADRVHFLGYQRLPRRAGPRPDLRSVLSVRGLSAQCARGDARGPSDRRFQRRRRERSCDGRRQRDADALGLP